MAAADPVAPALIVPETSRLSAVMVKLPALPLLIVEVVKRMFTRQVSVRSLSGPIGIGQQIHQAASMPGWMPLVGLMSYISINLCIFNLLPILSDFRRVEVGFLAAAAVLCALLYALYRDPVARPSDAVAPGSSAEIEARLAAAEEAG